MKHCHTLIIRAIPIPRFNPRREGEYLRSVHSQPVPPTQEQLEDDGSADGVPVVLQPKPRWPELLRIARLVKGSKGYNHGGGPKPRPCVLTRLSDGHEFRFLSLKDACAWAGVNPCAVYTTLERRGNEYKGFRWRIGGRE